MNLALLHYSAPPVVGGVESVLAYQARLMADAGHNVKVLAGRGAQFDSRIPFIHLPLADSRHPEILAVKAELDSGHVPPRFFELVSAIHADLAAALAGIDVLVAHNVCSLAKNLPLTSALHELVSGRDRPGLIIWHHDLAWTTPRYRSELHDGYPWDLLRQDWLGAHQIAVSDLRQRELSELLDVPLERIRVVPNGVDFARFLKLESSTIAFVKQLDLLAAEPILLLPVRITTRKNIELALRSLVFLRKTLPSAALVVTGPLGPHNPANLDYFARLTSLRSTLDLDGAAHFLAELTDEFLPDDVISDFYHLADALFLPSREEGFGIPILEAGLAGLPVFCADIPPLRKLGGDHAVYFSPDAEPAQVASLIASRLAPDPIFGLRRQVRRKFTWERIYAEKIAPLLSLAGG